MVAAIDDTKATYEDQFLTILHNRSQDAHQSRESLRRNGFVVLAHGGTDLGALQALCVDPDKQTASTCLTVRYRLRAGRVFGTLIAAFISDLQSIGRGEPDLRGEFMPVPSTDLWQQFLQACSSSFADFPFAGWTECLQGNIDIDKMLRWRELFESYRVFPEDHRLVLFGEIIDANGEHPEWGQTMPALFTSLLPERVGLVLHGAPAGFALPPDDPHFLEISLPEQSGAPTDDKVEYLIKYRPSSFVSDVPAQEDYLGVNDYAEAFARFILHPQTRPPLTIGIQGRWGKGKSSFMELIDSALVKMANLSPTLSRLERLRLWIRRRLLPPPPLLLQAWEDAGQTVRQHEAKVAAAVGDKSKLQSQLERARTRRAKLWARLQRAAYSSVLIVRFNAWQSEDAKQIWAGLAHVVSERLEGALSWTERLRLRVAYAWQERRSELLLNLFLPVALAVVVMLYVSWVGVEQLKAVLHDPDATKNLPAFGSLLKALLPAGSVLFLGWWALARLIAVVQPVSQRVLSYMQLPTYREQMGYQHRVLSDLRFVHQRVTRRWPDCKAVVFIDDLDRCSEGKIMEVLQAINLILGGSNFFVFLGMDTEMIYRAIRVSYRKDQKDEPLPANFPESYLHKIVQLSFHLPPTPPERRFTFLSTLFSSTARSEFEKLASNGAATETVPTPASDASTGLPLPFDLTLLQKPRREQWSEIEDTADELTAFHDYTTFLEDNPREIKRIVNIHRLVKIFLQRQHTAWLPDRQRKLVKWLIFCATWPDLIDDILQLQDSSSNNCLTALAERLNMTGERAQAFGLFKKFAAHKDELTSSDIDADFICAARISQLVSESQATLPPTSPAPSLALAELHWY